MTAVGTSGRWASTFVVTGLSTTWRSIHTWRGRQGITGLRVALEPFTMISTVSTPRQPGKLLSPTPGLRINGHVNQRRRTAGKRLLQRRAELFWRFDVIPLATECFDHFVIAGIWDKGAWGQRCVLRERRWATANTVVIKYNPGNGQLVAHPHLPLHAAKANRAI